MGPKSRRVYTATVLMLTRFHCVKCQRNAIENDNDEWQNDNSTTHTQQKTIFHNSDNERE